MATTQSLSQVLSSSGVALPNYYRSSDPGIDNYQYIGNQLSDAQSKNKPATIDFSKVMTLGAIRGEQDPFYLQSLGQLALSSSVDADTQAMAKRQLTLINQDRTKAGLKTLAIPGTQGSTLTAPAPFTDKAPAPFSQQAPTMPTNPGSAPVKNIAPVKTNSVLRPGGGYAQQADPTDQKRYDAQLAAYNTSLTAYNNNVQAYPGAMSTYQTNLNSYNSALNNWNTQNSNYQSNLSVYQLGLQTYTQAKANEDAQNANLDKNLAIYGQQSQQQVKTYQDALAAQEQQKKQDILHYTLGGLSKFFSGTVMSPGLDKLSPNTFRPTLGGGK